MFQLRCMFNLSRYTTAFGINSQTFIKESSIHQDVQPRQSLFPSTPLPTTCTDAHPYQFLDVHTDMPCKPCLFSSRLLHLFFFIFFSWVPLFQEFCLMTLPNIPDSISIFCECYVIFKIVALLNSEPIHYVIYIYIYIFYSYRYCIS